MSEPWTIRDYFWQAGWAVVFAANLIVPLHEGLAMTHGGGRWGLGLATILFWLLGHLGCARLEKFGPVVVVGGVLVGLSQRWGYLQIMAGYVSVQCVFRAGMAGGSANMPNRLTESGGFVATFLTGGLLFLASVLCGLAVRAVAHLARDDADWS